LLFWWPWKREPLYSKEVVTPGCSELAGGGGSTLTGMLSAVVNVNNKQLLQNSTLHVKVSSIG